MHAHKLVLAHCLHEENFGHIVNKSCTSNRKKWTYIAQTSSKKGQKESCNLLPLTEAKLAIE
jgi:hypothetical protein